MSSTCSVQLDLLYVALSLKYFNLTWGKILEALDAAGELAELSLRSEYSQHTVSMLILSYIWKVYKVISYKKCLKEGVLLVAVILNYTIYIMVVKISCKYDI